MLHITKETTRSPEEVVKLASDFFGPKGLGLEEKARNACCINSFIPSPRFFTGSTAVR